MSEWPSMTTMSSHFIEEDVHEPNVSKWRIRWSETIPYILLHVACIGVFWVGFSWAALALCLGMYVVRMFAITGFYHRYFSHRTFRTTRPVQFLMGLLGTSAVQRGPIWWAAHHRHHHRKSDQDGDLHSPVQTSLLWSHVGWQYHRDAADHDDRVIRDFKRTFPELSVIDRFAWVSPLALVAICVMLWGWQGLVISFAWSTVACWHATFTINSLCHVWGAQPFETGDTSRNNFLLALLVMGEGWHNNHHAFQSSCRQGHTWWQLDLTWEILRLGQALGLVTQVKHPPKRAMAHWA